MSFYDSEFTDAYLKTKGKHPAIGSEVSAREFLIRLERRSDSNKSLPEYRRQKYGELIRLTLNQCGIADRKKRSAYSALTGHFYGNRGRKAKRKPTVVKEKPSPAVNVLLDRNSGQLGWEI